MPNTPVIPATANNLQSPEASVAAPATLSAPTSAPTVPKIVIPPLVPGGTGWPVRR